MANFYAYKYSTSHMFFPKIIITLLIVLGLIIIIPKIIKAVKDGKKNGFRRPRFFVENYDKLKFWGTILLLILYVLALEWISAVISIVATLAVWYIFGGVFRVPLP